LKTARVLACCLLLLPLGGSVSPTETHTRAKSLLPSQPRSAQWHELRRQLDRGNASFHSGHYIQANQVFISVRESAREARVWDLAARAGGNTGSCQFALHQYRFALPSYLDARRLATLAADWSEVAILDSNIASLYSEMGDLETAASWMQGTLERLSGEDRVRYLPEILIQLALVRARQGHMPEALALFRRGIDRADRAGNVDLYTVGWNRMGIEYLNQGNLPAADAAFLEAYRVRKFNRLPMESCYRNLGRLRMEQGDLESASHLLDRCLELAQSPHGAIPAWDVYQLRGRVRLAQGRLPEALQDLRIAVNLARAWRWSNPSNEAGRRGAEEMLDQVYSALIEAGNRLYLRTRNPALLRETFEAAEENRAASLRALVAGPRSASKLSPAYWEALLHLQRAEIQALQAPSPAARAQLASARAELIALDAGEFSSVSGPPGSEGLTGRVQKALDSRSALLSFHLGDSMSWMWALDRSGLVLYSLPPRRQIEDRVAVATGALRDNLPHSIEAGAALYQTLFGPLAPRFQRKTRWLLALDQGEHSAPARTGPTAPGLFDTPLSALAIETKGPRPVFVAERHNTVLIPGAAFWAEAIVRHHSPPLSPVFVGVGDAIYNTADPRLPATPAARQTRSAAFSASASTSLPSLALPRLVASGPELDACARAWAGERVLLKGAEASRDQLEKQIRRNPAVLHFATHFLPSDGARTSGLIALSLNPHGETELLAPEEIAHWNVNGALVVLSGCHSTQGAVLPGTGLLGLTRAWLAAGAQSVIGSRWSTPDDSGVLFSALYRILRGQAHPDPSEALRAAQVEMIHAGGWRAHPRYWGTYLTVGSQ
jgi:CHAT domain-containing protein